MRISLLSGYALCMCVASTTLAGCGGSQVQFLGTGAVSVGASQARTGDVLLYISNSAITPSGSYVLTWSVGGFGRGQFVGALPTDKPQGECTRRSGPEKSSELIATESDGKVALFLFNGTLPFETLSDRGQPMSCAINPTNGDLAVANYNTSSERKNGAADVAIYRSHKRGYYKTPEVHPDNAMAHFYYCGYDPDGNLYADGMDQNGHFAFAKLAPGKSQWQAVTLNQKIKAPGGVQWDGRYIAVGDAGVSPSVIYQFKVSGRTATEIGSTILRKSIAIEQFFIDHHTLIGPDKDANDIGIWSYPRGGRPNELFRGQPNYLDEPAGAALVFSAK